MITIAAVIAVLMYSVILHEVAHGAAAYLLGDPTARDQKRLTLNPLRHIDPVGTVLLPIALVLLKSPVMLGWAKPVPFDPRYFKDPRSGTALVSLAGPATNFVLAAGFAAALRFFPDAGPAAATVLFYGVVMNLILGLFNLMPIPPMDGSKAIGVYLPDRLRRAYFSLDRIGFVLIFLLLYLGLFSKVLEPLYGSLLRFLIPA